MAKMADILGDMWRCKLKDVEVASIETALAETISKLAGTPYRCSISGMKFSEGGSPSAKLKLELTEVVDYSVENFGARPDLNADR